MLVLARQRDQTVVIDDDIEVTVVDIRGDKTRLGVEADRSIEVHRKEVQDQINRERKESEQHFVGPRLPLKKHNAKERIMAMLAAEDPYVRVNLLEQVLAEAHACLRQAEREAAVAA